MSRIDRAMVLSAGLGRRMRPITDSRPKPLIAVGGRTMLDRALDALAEAGVTDAVVNVHYLADQIEEHLAHRARPPQTHISDERVGLLETGGGIARALPLLGDGPFLSINGDAVWCDGPHPTLGRLVEAFDSDRMDGLLLLIDRDSAVGLNSPGDFFLDDSGRVAWRGSADTAPWLYGGIQILHPRIFTDLPEGPFSLLVIYRRLVEAGRLFGLPHNGQWAHVGTPNDIAPAEAMLAAAAGAYHGPA